MSERQIRNQEIAGAWVERGVSYLESDRVSLPAAALTFVCALTFRNYLKIFSDEARYTPLELFHSSLFYISLAVSIGLLLHFVTRTSIIRTIKVLLPCFILVVVPPIIDLLATCGSGVNVAYYDPMSPTDMLNGFLTLGGPCSDHGFSPGQRVEILLILIGCYFYVRSQRKSRGLALLATAAAYAIVFVHSCWPFVLKTVLSLGGIRPNYSNELFAGSFALVVLVTGTIAARRAEKTAFARFFLDFNMLRFVHYIAMFGWGFVRTAPGYPLLLDQTTLLSILLITASVFLAMLFKVHLERISRSETEPDGRVLIFPSLSLFYACLAGFDYGFLVGVFLGNFYLYHAPPVALIRVRMVSRIIIAANSLLLIIAGYLIRKQAPPDLDPWIVIVVLVGATAFGLVELVWGKRRPNSHHRFALLAGHLASVAVMLVYQIIYSQTVQERLQTLFSAPE